MNSLLRDTTGKRSTKRVITMTAAACLVGAFLADAVTDVTIDHALLSAVQTLALVGLGAVTAEHFSPAAGRIRKARTHENPTP
jgi:hypothetical protein